MPKIISRGLLFTLAVLVIIVIIGYGSFQVFYHYTSAPEFCSGCHYVKPYVASWAESPHKDMNCMECHEPSGPLGKLHSKARGLNYYISDITGDHSEPLIKAEYIDEQNCFGCHTGQNKSYPNAASIRSSKEHLHYIEENKDCSTCHNQVGHLTNIEVKDIFD